MCGTFEDYCPVYSKTNTVPALKSPLNLPTLANNVTNELVISDVAFLSVKDKVPPNYVVVSDHRLNSLCDMYITVQF